MSTLQQLTVALVEIVHEHERQCRCQTCHKQGLQCLDCTECRQIVEEQVLDALRKVNRQ